MYITNWNETPTKRPSGQCHNPYYYSATNTGRVYSPPADTAAGLGFAVELLFLSPPLAAAAAGAALVKGTRRSGGRFLTA